MKRTPVQFDLTDLLLIVGILLVGAAVWLVASWPGVLGYIGCLCLAAAALRTAAVR